MKAFAVILALVLWATVIAGSVDRTAPEIAPRYMAVCMDGDGPVGQWMTSRYEAYLDGRDHERTTRGHRWEIWTQDGETKRRDPVCSRIVAGTKPDTMMVVNTCGKCLKFLIARTNADGSVNAKEFTMKPNSGRNFRVVPKSKITVDSERDCPE